VDEPQVHHISNDRVKITAIAPLIEIIGSFNDRILSITEGYASFDYEPEGWRPVDLVCIDINLNGEKVDFLAIVLPKSKADAVARQWVTKLADLIPKQQFAVAIQAVIGRKPIARETISALRKDVIGKCVLFNYALDD